MSLKDIQQQFRAFLLDQPHRVTEHVGADAEAGLAVYHHAYRAQLADNLRDTFDRTWAWLGDDAFDAAIADYIAEHPPRSWTISDYGADFPESLQQRYEDAPEVAELALLDWSLRRAFDGPDARPFPAAELAAVDWTQARLHLAPTLRVWTARTNVGLLWSALNEGHEPPQVQWLPEPAAIRVWRKGLQPHYQTVDTVEAYALGFLQTNPSFAALCDALAERFGEERAGVAAGQLLADWLRDELIIAID